MSKADLVAALETCVAALEAAPARERIDFEPYWQWMREATAAVTNGRTALEAETTRKP